MPRAVVAIGGNSLITDSQHQSVQDQYLAAAETDHHIAAMVAAGWDLVITHGNGPQVGFILRRSDLARHELHEVPLEVCVADTQGSIGYLLQQNLLKDFRRMGIDKAVATVVTQVEVAADDAAFNKPTKPIGSFLTASEARDRQELDGWDVVEDADRGWRRVVASPAPVRIVEMEVIRHLLEGGHVVIAAGGGGIPVVADAKGDLTGVPAVIDKDHASSLLANDIGAELLLISTSISQVALDFGTPDQRFVSEMRLEDAKRYLADGHHFKAGSMEPKIAAVIDFLEGGGQRAIITMPQNIEAALAGSAGTHIVH